MRPALLLLFCGSLLASSNSVLIVADEFPAMEVVAARLKASEGIESTLVKQTAMPADLSQFSALIVYIHMKMGEPAEKTFIQYAESGVKLEQSEVYLNHVFLGSRTLLLGLKYVGCTDRQDLHAGPRRLVHADRKGVGRLLDGRP